MPGAETLRGHVQGSFLPRHLSTDFCMIKYDQKVNDCGSDKYIEEEASQSLPVQRGVEEN